MNDLHFGFRFACGRTANADESELKDTTDRDKLSGEYIVQLFRILVNTSDARTECSSSQSPERRRIDRNGVMHVLVRSVERAYLAARVGYFALRAHVGERVHVHVQILSYPAMMFDTWYSSLISGVRPNCHTSEPTPLVRSVPSSMIMYCKHRIQYTYVGVPSVDTKRVGPLTEFQERPIFMCERIAYLCLKRGAR